MELEILRESEVVTITIELSGSMWRDFDEEVAGVSPHSPETARNLGSLRS